MSPEEKGKIQKINKERLSFSEALEKLFPTFFNKRDIFKKPESEVRKIIDTLPEKDKILVNTIYNRGKAIKDSLDELVLPIKEQKKKERFSKKDINPEEDIKERDSNNIIKELEKERDEEIDKMLEKKAVKIEPKNFNFVVFGLPLGQSISEPESPLSIVYENTYIPDSTNNNYKYFFIQRRKGKVIYVYTTSIINSYNMKDFNGRGGSYFGMSFEFNNLYCTDIVKLEELFDTVLAVAISKGNGFELISDTGKWNTKDTHSEKIMKFINYIKNEILDNFNDLSLKNCFREIDSNFNKTVNENQKVILHHITKEKNSKVLPNYFDFDKNEIIEKYKRLIEIEAQKEKLKETK